MKNTDKTSLLKQLNNAQAEIAKALDPYYSILYKPSCPWEISELGRVQGTIAALIAGLQ